MKYKLLRAFMKDFDLIRSHTISNTTLIIDGCCFKQMYKNSGCSYILGGEYDRFASYLRNILSQYLKSNIKCYVIFNGATNIICDVQKQKHVHREMLTRIDGIEPGDTEYFEPLFTNDVCLDVLNELGIKYYICRYNFKETLLCLARRLKCLLVTNNFEYALFSVAVVPFKTLVYDPKKKCITCSMYHHKVCRETVWKRLSDDMMSLVLTITDEDSEVYNELLDTFQCVPEQYIHKTHCWLKHQDMESAMTYMKDNLKDETQKAFLDTFAEWRRLFSFSLDMTIVLHILNRTYVFEQYWFEHAVGTGRIANPFINLMQFGILSGSSLIYDEGRIDAVLSAIDIALYGMSLLTDMQEVGVTFIGRKHRACVTTIINKIINITEVGKHKLKNKLYFIDNFQIFLTEQLQGFEMRILEGVPEDCWILLITLLYYSTKSGRHFTKETYCIILSYVLLGPVSDNIGLIKRSNLSMNHQYVKEKDVYTKNSLTYEQCNQAANSVIDLFCLSERGLQHVFDRDTLHTFAEFQHSLQFMNYLNKLCGERIKCTAYHKAINFTFIYKLFVVLKDKTAPGAYIENILECSPVYSYFRNILHTYYQALASLIINEINFV
ncbi:uncharacterized protein [Epargyreus clarus]